ncbi:MAG: sigma-70 family RNA polymerase sigma factor [Planctomycetota bacterium]
MAVRPEPRTNEDWILALRAGGASATRELEQMLERTLRKMMRGRFAPQDIPELVQESLTRIVESLEAFRGDSTFTTWAIAIATRVAFTELRRRATRSRLRGAVEASFRDARHSAAASPEAAIGRQELLAALDLAIRERLSARQRFAVLAELRGVPTITIAERLATNQNALYKLVHDARKKLRQALIEAGHDADAVRHYLSESAR